tara:strand:- start:492 stop:866 length:375 start_codon:yes stop_codon:yes gene_type:complete
MIFVGVIAALGGIDTFVNAEMWAESAWGAEISPESKNIAETYEKIWGLFLLPLAGLCITAALVLDEKNRAVMAFYSGLVMLAFFGLFFSVMQTLDYKSPALPFMLMPIVIVSLLIYSGYKHKDN